MRRILFILLLLAAAVDAGAQRPQARGFYNLAEMASRNRFAWEYDADFQFHFDNREFSRSQDAITPSMTVNTVVFAPTVGFSIQQNARVQHRLTAGVELAHDLGSQTWSDLPREMLLFYDAHVRTAKGMFEGLAGVFPRRYMEGSYSEAFYSDSLRFADRNLEGILLKWRSERFYAELGCDWMGQAGYDRKERFQVFSAGRWQAAWWVSLGWTGRFYHYAGSVVAPGVVDNHLLHPWVRLDFSSRTPWQELSLQAGPLVGYQRDRVRSAHHQTPVGGEVAATVRRWNVMLQNTAYFGQDLQPLWHDRDLGGAPYGHDLYFGSPFYTGFYDRLEAAWEPALTHYLSLRIAARAHFSSAGYLGCQQVLSLRLSLDAMRHRDTALGRCL